jgi:hypothetical protein
MNNDIQIIDLTPENIADYGVCGYKDVNKHKELSNKIAWFNKYYSKGLKKGFMIADKAKPDFELLAYMFDKESTIPSFKSDILDNLNDYKDGLTIIRSAQCPYTEKNVNAIVESTERKFKIKTNLIDLIDSESAQKTPCAFGTFCIIYNGEIISYHPISNTRFENIMNKMV